NDAVYYDRPQPLRHPLVFYFGHTAVFFINKLVVGGFLQKRINSRLESVFAIGVDEMSWDDLNDAHYDWPTVDETREYRKLVNVAVNEFIDNVKFEMPIEWNSPMWPVIMGIEHERIHIETSSVLFRQLLVEKVKKSSDFIPCTTYGDAPENVLIPVKGATVKLGKDKNHRLYGWDNEYGKASFQVEDFKASKYLVSNGEFLQFINDGGYSKDEYWSDEGKAWKAYHKAVIPEFWRGEAGNYRLRLMNEEIELPLNWPAEVSYLEAKAFCNWKGKITGQSIRMPDEAEYRRLLELSELDREHCEEPINANWNLEKFASSSPVDMFKHGEFYDLTGNVWQWNETPIYGFDGFEVHPLYDDFSVPTFDNRHALIKGGSWISTGNEIALNSRYAFRRHFYQHAGFRYVESNNMVKDDFDIYETDELIGQYCEFHYGDNAFDTPNFSMTIAGLAVEQVEPKRRIKALDIGCSVGRAAFHLAESFETVDALDFSARFIQIAARMQKSGSIMYERKEEGDLVSFQKRSLQDLGLIKSYDNINFMQQDATNLKPVFTGYDLVVAANLIDRLYDPAKFLKEIKNRMNSKGILFIASPYTWLEDFTPKHRWIGGFKKDGEVVTTIDGLHEILDEHFTLINEPFSVPFILRETARKFQHTLSNITIWQLKK
ncbi:MAG: 5-histidylcysteine sulfoxide synthase, partial [Deltaproteobacteria bacterium]|nr:5-histidylcysteine sulfoxide synthase [Deltaproteobacteria bacterium]